jgi:lipid kinase YegS
MPDSKSACLVLHGKVAMRNDVRAAVDVLRAHGHHVDVRVTWEGGDAKRFAAEARDAGLEMVIAGGGDGTINEVVTGLFSGDASNELPIALGIMPLGTANDLARACGIPLDPLAALTLAVEGVGRAVDVGRVSGRCFLNVATGGFGTQVTIATPNEMKKILGRVAYLVTGLTRFSDITPAQGRLLGPGLKWEGMFLILAIGNGRQAGGGHQLCPEALVDDGLLDVRVLPRLPADEIPVAFRALLNEGTEGIRRSLVSARVAWLEIEADEPLQINLDGEPIESTRFRFDVMPQRLVLKLPADCPLLSPSSQI